MMLIVLMKLLGCPALCVLVWAACNWTWMRVRYWIGWSIGYIICFCTSWWVGFFIGWFEVMCEMIENAEEDEAAKESCRRIMKAADKFYAAIDIMTQAYLQHRLIM
jgi:hypothetical protein